MSIYRRKNHAFNARLAVRRDELRHDVATTDEQGRVVIAMFPAMTFPSVQVAKRFLLRLLKGTK